MNSAPILGKSEVVQECQTPDVAATESVSSTISIKEMQEKLLKIIEKNSDWKDPLSEKLHLWAFTPLSIPEDTKISAIEEEAFYFLSILENQIMVDFLGITLFDPIIDGEYVWDRRNLETYSKLCDTSPLTGEKIAFKTHVFAKEILLWKEELKSSYPFRHETEMVLSTLKDLQDLKPEHALVLYHTLAQTAISIQEKEKQIEMLRAATERAKNLRSSIRQKSEEEKGKVQESIERLQSDMQERIKSLSEKYKKETEELRSRLENQETTSESNRANARLLQGEIQELIKKEANLKNELKELKNQASRIQQSASGKKKKGGCVIL